MESLAHSRPPNKKTYNNVNKTTTSGSSSGSTIYDDVFGGPPRFGAPSTTLSPRMEDYAEIFGSFHAARASSIPVLDLPAVEESEVCFDVKSSRFDYTEVFGGVEDFGLSFDDLVCQSTAGYDGSSDDAWTPAGSKSLSGESDRSLQNQCSPNGDPYQSVNGTTEFNISYHKTSARNNGEIANGETHVSQINNVPGFTYVVDETSSTRRVEAKTPSLQVADYDRLDMDTNGVMLLAKHSNKSMSHPANSIAGSKTLSHDLKCPKESTKSGFHAHEPFVTISEINLKTKPSDLPPPSRPPPELDVKKGISKSSSNGAILSEESAGKSSPPYFDVEVDSNSSAAASVAAMKEAMEKAQARLKSAKEEMERRKDGVQCCTKSGSVDAVKNKEGKISKAPNRPSSSKYERPLGSYDAENSGIKHSIGEERPITSDKTEAAQNLLQEGFYDFVHRSGEERLGKKSWSSQVSDDIDGAGEWKEETQFFELVKSDKPREAFEQINSANLVAPNSDGYEFGRKKKRDVVMEQSEQLEGTNIENATIKDHVKEKKEKKLKEVIGACEQVENNECLKATREKHRKKDIENKTKAVSLASDQEKNKEKFRTDQLDVRTEKKLDTKKKAKAARAPSERAENKEKFKTAQQYIRGEMKLTEPSDDLVEIQLNEKANEVELTAEHSRKEKKLIDSNEIMENETQQECHGGDYNVKGQKKASELQGNEKEVRMSLGHVKTDERRKDSGNRKKSKSKILETENVKQQKETCWPEIGVNRMNGALQPEENEKRHAEVFEKEEHEKKLTDTHEREEKEKRSIRSSEHYISRILHKAEDMELSEARSGENYVQLDVELEMSEKGIRNTDIQNESNGTVHEHADGDKDKISDHMEMETLSAPAKVNVLGNKQKNQTNQSSHENDEVEEQLKETIEAFTCEVHVKESAAVEDGKVLEPVKSFIVENEHNTSSLAESASENGRQQRVNEATDLQAENEKKACDSGAGSAETWVGKNKSVSELDCKSENHGKKPENDGIETQKDNVHVQVELSEIKNKFRWAQVIREPIRNGKKIEVDPPASSVGMGNNQHTSQQACSCPSYGKREKGLNEAVEIGERETEKMKRERVLEEERLRKIEEEREREREREKDRMALDKKTLEIREKASGERVAAEGRQRAMAEARERLERACAEAREKTLAEKTSDARLRAERAAVERATAEARARAAEKAMAERAALGNERMERSVSDKFFVSSRSGGLGQSSSYSDSKDHQFRSASFSSNTRYQDSSAYYARSEGVEGDSAQRCKARLERHRRTAERAAKALAEKNMRDLIVQREQAERSRLAETLDADVKRWSSGKQGNLRALLSTLQYILGPESGWQPIPLTEVITSAAVKKAYRKATLCVHPDKLQQRSATIQQKYICEKVFDLLKEAWTKFNSEER